MNRYVIVGNGIAGVSAAGKIRERDGQGQIQIITSEQYACYSRPMLPRVISGQSREEEILVHSSDWYPKNNIELVLNEEMVAVDRERSAAISAGGRQYAFDRLLIATGSSSFIPPIKGVDKTGVMALRSLADCHRIQEHVKKSKSAVVIGGGVLGLEAAGALSKFGIRIAIVESSTWLLPRQLDMVAAEILKKQLEAKTGFVFHLSSQTQQILGDGQVSGVLLAQGQTIPADLILVSAGVRPNLALAQKMGLKIGRGVVVDDRLETSIKGIFAAGDVAEHRGVLYGLWSASQEQGEAAGINMAGGAQTYQGTVPSNRVNVLGIRLISAGQIDVEGKLPGLVRKDELKSTYRKLVLKEGIIVGCILLNDMRGSEEILKAMEKGKDVSPFKDDLLDESFDFRRIV